MTATMPGSQSSLREANQRRVIRAVRAAGSLTQAEIARATGLSAATVSNIVRELKEAGTLLVTPTSAGGRRAQSVSLSRRAGLALAVDFGHSHLRVAVGDMAHEVLAEETVPLDVDASAEEGLRVAQRLVEAVLRRAEVDRSEVVGVGLGVPGPIDTRTGTVGSSTILPGWVGVSPQDALAERLGLPVHVDNDANLGALGELVWGAGRGMTDLAYIKVATGVGAGLVIGGRIYRGSGGTAGEIGHITIDDTGKVCRCGNRGCLETFVGAPFLLELLRHSHGELSLHQVITLAKEGDQGSRRVIADAGRHIGVGVANLCNLLNPQAVIVGGELAQAGEILLGPIREAVDRYAIPSAARALTVTQGALGERAEMLGALALVLHESELLPGDVVT
ncbi:ROK family transcriptional regulator [Carbonactinospora thermoautotrophica]|uniref:ROK family transcriptional regulator n=1 Tax=Carbonactinospora thermoautotrophica TaxID=1469144 RepID=UPI00226E9643|nr:ROK family transcriptional regulator [Carbonactinospora thermoautotrophica]